MRALLQRVSRSSVTVENEVTGSIDGGLLVLAAVGHGDTPEDAEWLARKVVGLRIFPDENGRMNRSVAESGGKILLVSQFTLYGDARKGRRPSFTDSAPPDVAVPLLDDLKRCIEAEGVAVETGRFGAHMQVDLLNDGPVTLMLDSQDRPNRAAPPAPSLPRGRFRLVGEGSPLARERLVLASGSPRRRELLGDLGLAFTVESPDVDERTDLPTDPEEHALAVAERKLRAFTDKYPESILLAADTVVVVDQRILGKPGDAGEAAGMLRLLRGREHRVITGLCVAHPVRDVYRQRAVSTTVRFHDLDDEAIDRYVATGEPFGKAGAYAIQGLGGLLVAGIEGDYTNVVGLPLGATLDLLEEVLGAAPARP
jgi:MAF protein/D-tyrosyl-tRNA(Tyr) deacylase